MYLQIGEPALALETEDYRATAVLHEGPVKSAADAVRAAIASEQRKRGIQKGENWLISK
jgi:hypothetical protein